MFRPPVASILVLTLASFSCNLTGAGPPAVSEAVLVDVAPAPESTPAESPADRLNGELVSAIADYLAARDTGLARAQIFAVAETVVTESQPRGLEPWLVVAVMEVESGFDPFAVSSARAFGLMQILLPTGKELAYRRGIPWHGTATLFDPTENTKLGIAYLEELRDRFGDLRTALAAYNWGPGRIKRRIQRGRPLPAGYSNRVLDNYSNAFVSRHGTS